MKLTKSIIARDGKLYLAWPDIVQTTSGRLVCACSACTSHCDRSFTQIRVMLSDDAGKTWTAMASVGKACGLKNGGYYYNNISLSTLPDGRIAMACDRIEDMDENTADSTIMLSFSSDEGKTWSEFHDTPAKGIVPDKLFVTSSGRWLLPCHFFDVNLGKLVQRLWFSDDCGTTWNGPVIVGRDASLNLCEASIVQINGTLVCFMRENSSLGLPAYRSFSTDNGLTWSGVHPFPLPGCHRPKIGCLSDGRYLISYRYSIGGSTPFHTSMIAVTNADSILNPEYMACSCRLYHLDTDNSLLPDTGYTGWVERKGGHLFCVNYIRDDWPRGQIRGYDIEFQHPEQEGDLRL